MTFRTTDWSSLSCTQAELGHYVPLPGSSISLLCEPGYYSARGSSYCSPCKLTRACRLQLKKRLKVFLAKNAVFDQADLPSSGKKIRPLPAKTRPCAFGLHHCPVYGQWQKGTFLKGFECIDTQHELESCGGCVHNDSPDGEVNNRGGQDCSAITGVDTVRCVQGRCVIGKSLILSCRLSSLNSCRLDRQMRVGLRNFSGQTALSLDIWQVLVSGTRSSGTLGLWDFVYLPCSPRTSRLY